MKHLSNKCEKFAADATLCAYHSPCQMRHGCVAVVGGKVIARGFNHYRCCSNDGIIGENSCTCHAECDVLRRLNKMNYLNSGKKITFYIMRIGEGGDLRNSAPCGECYLKMLEYGIKTIIYSNDDGSFEKILLKDYVPKVVTTGQRWVRRQINNV